MAGRDTIVALSSGALPSGLAVIRLSGPAVESVLLHMLSALPPARKLVLAPIAFDGTVFDQGLVAYFPAPNSFTGESCAELHLHGSRAVVAAVLRQLTQQPGLRLAEAGEFTRRAFENGKLDLTEVEGLGDLLEAETENQRQLALQRLSGGLSAVVLGWREVLLDLRAEIEAQLDFSDEGDVAAGLPPRFADQVIALEEAIGKALAGLEGGRITREGFRVALAGAPNAGKSSLLNALARSDIAIVSEEAGTTRDVREVALDLGGQLVILVDMAGLRDTDSKAEAEGVRRARQEIARADLVLWLNAPDAPSVIDVQTPAPVLIIATKADLVEGQGEITLSARTGQGIPALFERIAGAAAAQRGGEPALISRERDRIALEQAREALAALALVDELEVKAEMLREASATLERLLGRIDAEAVLGRLFSAFCIGK